MAVSPLVAGEHTATFLDASDWWVAVSRQTSNTPTKVSKIVVYETDNSGRNWKPDSPSLAGEADSVFFLNATDGWLEVSNGEAMGWNPVDIYGTRNGGGSWILLSAGPTLPGGKGAPGALPSSCDKAGLTFSSPATGWAAMGCNGRSEALARSDTGGRTWSIVSLNLSAEATSGGVSVWPPMFSDDDGAFGLAARRVAASARRSTRRATEGGPGPVAGRRSDSPRRRSSTWSRPRSR